MTETKYPAVVARACRLVAYLHTIQGEEQEKAQSAANILQLRIDEAVKKMDDSSIDALEYGMGVKGIHDWAWTGEIRKQIEEITNDY